jgi:uncharacterized protein (DUF427 family)
MTLTLGRGPLAQPPTSSLNFSLDEAPKHRLVFEDYPRRMRALLGGHAVLDSTAGKLLHETAHLPVYYAPVDDLDEQYLEASEHTTHCPFKGDASYWSLRVGERLIENAIWHYPQPLEASSWLEGYCSLYAGAPDVWLQEDEPVRGHLRDPYHRVDVLETSRQVEVRLGGEPIAESDRPKLVFETGLAPRVYLLRADVVPGLLEPSEKTSFCPYKGRASYWHLRFGEQRLEDGAWSYEEPLPEALKAAGHLCFDGEGIEVAVS